MIRLHVINNQIINRTIANNILNIIEIFINKRTFNRVNQCYFFINK